jgi:prolyl 4-hydroxylase
MSVMAAEPVSKPYYESEKIPFAYQRSPERAAFGRSVGDKLESATDVRPLCGSPDRPVQIYVRDEFLNEAECKELARQIDAGCYPSKLYEQEKHKGARTSRSCNLNSRDPLVAAVDSRIAGLLGLDRALGEPLQGQRYKPGQQFKGHVDFFYVDQPYWPEYSSHGGQRTWTAMIYLVAPQRGGGTRFSLLDVEVEPKLGRLLVWNNMALDGSPNPWTLHSGEPVAKGTKYIVTKWYREQPFV